MIPRWSWMALVLVAAPLAAHAQNPRPITGEGTEGFRALLTARGLKPIDDVPALKEAIRVDPARVLIVAFRGADARGRPRRDGLEEIPFNLRSDFVEKGGGLFVATDQAKKDGWIRDFGAEVNGDQIFASSLAQPFGNQPECPYVRRAIDAVPNLFVKGESILRGVAANRPSSLKRSDALPSLALFPAPLWSHKASGNPELRNPVFAQGRTYPGGGRFLLLADHSVFINSMLLPQRLSNDNLQFAANCLDWMMLGPDVGSRTYVMFIEDGHIWKREDYNLMLQSLPPPRPEDIAELLWNNRDLVWEHRDLAEDLLARLEEDGVFAELERGDPLGNLISDNVSDLQIVRVVLVLGTVALLGFGLWSFMGAKGRLPKKAPRLALLLDRMRPRTGLLDLRLRSGLGSGQYYELARQRAREAFAELNLQPSEDGPPPRFTVEGGWRHRRRTARELREVWAVAYGREPVPVPARQWAQWQQRLNRLAVLIRGGAIRFE